MFDRLGSVGLALRARVLDHAAEVRDALDELLAGEEVTVEVSERALARAEGVWRAPQR